MDVRDVLTETYDRLPGLVRGAVDGLSPEQLRRAPATGANPVGWLVWHLTRIQDHHVAGLLDVEQVWVTGDWAGRFGLSPDPDDVGFGHTPGQVGTVRPESAQALLDYFEAVAQRTRGLLAGLRPADLDRVVDEAWDPPVTLGVRLVSVVEDDLQHVGQAAYVRGLLGAG
ncbi:DinB superfamily protein [Micromonospora sp. MW-13]|uniref:mycothiol transferase n=1 Tax=Micromonospora sp. MW-13 TaxID=2094022 RepID=UPI000E43234E|nr:DinB family protein [Micromonospora sp. MW-13]RGC67503.1 DinB superfamily protein [Micromonospora sp. MW-13]